MRSQEQDQELRSYLEPAQLVADTSRPLPRKRLSAGGTAGLWALRVFVTTLSAMVIYTFVSQVL
jgi:hypothetical protein